MAPIENAIFPWRCIKTNEQVARADHVVELDLFPNQVHASTSTGEKVATKAIKALVGRGAYQLIGKRRLRFRIGVCDRLRGLADRRWKLGLTLMAASPVFAIVGGISLIGLTTGFDAIDEDKWPLLFVPVSLLGLMVPGIILFGMSTMSLLQVVRSDGEYVWLKGASEEFLSSLPESPRKWS